MISKSCFRFFLPKKKFDYDLLRDTSREQKDKFDVTPPQQVPDPLHACYTAFGEAMRIIRSVTFSYEADSLLKWQAARLSCQPAGISFRDAVDISIWGHQTPLQCLASSYDHQALHFVHSCLPQGFYKGDIYLGNLGDTQPAKVIFDTPELRARGELTRHQTQLLMQQDFPFIYRGDIDRDEGNISGYGVVKWSKGRTYMGRWESEFTVWLEMPMTREMTWLCGIQPGHEDMRFLHAESLSPPFLMVYDFSDFT